jgi:hypothetical protein
MSKFDKIYADLGIINDKNDNNLVNNLTKTPKKEKNNIMPHSTASKPNITYQCDLLFLPKDGLYRYLLVAVDVATRKTDAIPLKSKNAKEVKNAMTKIFKGKILKQPKRLEVDAGSEFKGEFKEHFEKYLEIFTKIAGRHRQQSVVETKNQQIGKILNKAMLKKELENGQINRKWVYLVPKVIKLINEHFSHKAITPNPDLLVKTDKFSQDILPEGTSVRVQLDNPVDIQGKKLIGKFRTGDLRFENKIRHITRFYLRPNQPVLYQIDGNGKVSYTKYQLQVVKSNEI